MANIKFLKGLSQNLPIEKVDGYLYFTTDTNCFYIDFVNANGELVREKVSAEYADKLRYFIGNEIKELSAQEIASKSQVQIITWEEND